MRDSIFRRVKLLSGAASESGPNYGSPDPAPKMLKSIVFTKGITIGPEGLQIRKILGRQSQFQNGPDPERGAKFSMKFARAIQFHIYPSLISFVQTIHFISKIFT